MDPTDDGVLESRIPELNPWKGVAILALHSHTADAPCDSLCTEYHREPGDRNT